MLILTVLTGGAGGVLDTEARLDGVARDPVPSEGTRRRLFRSRALAQVDDAPSAFTTWGPLGAFASVGETVSFEIHARARDGTLLESFDDPSAFTVAFDGAPGAVLKSSVEPVRGGVFRASFVPSVAGELTVTLRVLGEVVLSSQSQPNPATVTARILPTDPGSYFELRGEAHSCAAGEAARFRVRRTLGFGSTSSSLASLTSLGDDDDPTFRFEMVAAASEGPCSSTRRRRGLRVGAGERLRAVAANPALVPPVVRDVDLSRRGRAPATGGRVRGLGVDVPVERPVVVARARIPVCFSRPTGGGERERVLGGGADEPIRARGGRRGRTRDCPRRARQREGARAG